MGIEPHRAPGAAPRDSRAWTPPLWLGCLWWLLPVRSLLTLSVYFTNPDHHLSLPWTHDSFRRIAKASSQRCTGQVSGPVVVLWSQWTVINLRRGLYWLGIAELTERREGQRSRLWEGRARLLLRLQQQRPFHRLLRIASQGK